MNPHQQNKVDIKSLTPEEQRLLRLYGKMPTKKDVLQNKLKERKYFDSGDYALSKAGKGSDIGVTNVGSRHPVPENIPHLSQPSTGSNGQGQIPGSFSEHPPSTGFSGHKTTRTSSLSESEDKSNDEEAAEEKERVNPSLKENISIPR